MSLDPYVYKMPRDPNAIICAVAEFYHVTWNNLVGKDRHRSIVLPRQIAMHLVRHNTPLSLDSIGLLFGGRDHTTVLHGVNRIRKRMFEDTELSACVNHLQASFDAMDLQMCVANT